METKPTQEDMALEAMKQKLDTVHDRALDPVIERLRAMLKRHALRWPHDGDRTC